MATAGPDASLSDNTLSNTATPRALNATSRLARSCPEPSRSLASRVSPGSSTPTSTLTWSSWFCSLPGHEYFCEVAEDFIEDDFNLTGLNAMVPFWKEAMEMVLDVEPGAPSSCLAPPWRSVADPRVRVTAARRGHLQNPRRVDCGGVGGAAVWPCAPEVYPHAGGVAGYGACLLRALPV